MATSKKKTTTPRNVSSPHDPRLSTTEMADGFLLTPAQLSQLDRIAAGQADGEGRVPAAREIVQALRLKADFALARPTARVDHRVGILLVGDPYAESGSAVLPPVIEVLALPQAEEVDDT